MITGYYDTSTVNDYEEIGKGEEPLKCALTQCVHLFSESAQDGDRVSFLWFLARLRF